MFLQKNKKHIKKAVFYYIRNLYIKNDFFICFPSILKNTLNPRFKLFFMISQKHNKTAFLIYFRLKKFFLL